MKTLFRGIIIGCCLFAASLITDGAFDLGKPIIDQAEARIGRPLTPASVAGVARRTTRRSIRRTTVYVSTLPRGCRAVVINGVRLQQCGGSYYQSHGSQYVVVNVN